MVLLKLASRNIWRSKKRSIILLVAVGIGLWAGIFLMAFYNGVIEQRVDNVISNELSHIQLHHPEFRKENDVVYALNGGDSILTIIQDYKNCKTATGRILLKGMIASPAGSSGITINGVIPENEDQLTNLSKKIVKGKYFDPLKKNELIMSERLRKKLKLDIKKKAILTFQDKQGNLASSAFRIVAIFKTISSPYDDMNVFVNIEDVDSLAELNNTFNEIAVFLKSNEVLTESQTTFQQQFPDLEVKNWMEISPEMGLLVSYGTEMVVIFMGIILLALAFGIINTMMMSVLERTHEIGMLLALGMNRRKIFTMILMETCLLIFAGCPFGILVAIISIAVANRNGITFSQMTEVYSSFGFDPIIYPSLDPNQFGLIMVMVVSTAIVSSLFPAIRAVRIKPAESLKK